MFDEDIRPHCKPDCIYPHFWIAHDHPELPLTFGAWLCDCATCVSSLRTWAERDPLLAIVLKTGADRVIVSASYALAAIDATGALEPLCYVRNDYLREVFVAQGPVPLGARWYSAALHEDKGLRAACRSHAARAPEGSPGGGAEADNPPMPRIPLVAAGRRGRGRRGRGPHVR